jgi:dTDP-4-amino-4,6-dideoxygalactose transaminase
VKARIPFAGLERQHAAIREEICAAFERVVDSSAFILGEEVERFEEEIAAYCGVRHCIGVGSGTAALTLAMRAAGVGAGDEVIVPAHTFVASAFSVMHAGATPVLCDVEEDTGLIDLDSARAAVTRRTAAILPVHLYGQVCDMDAIGAFAADRGLLVLEDGAQAHGASLASQRVGSFGTAAAFSFYPSKNLGALGDAGAICCNDAEIAEKARLLRNLGRRGKDEHLVAGFNERLDGLQAALLRVKLPYLDRWNEQRCEHASAYREVLDDRIRLLPQGEEHACAYHVFPIRVPERNDLRARLGEAGIETGVHYSRALHEQPALSELSEPPADFPAATAWASDELSLPMFPELHIHELEEVAEICNAAATTPLYPRVGSDD